MADFRVEILPVDILKKLINKTIQYPPIPIYNISPRAPATQDAATGHWMKTSLELKNPSSTSGPAVAPAQVAPWGVKRRKFLKFVNLWNKTKAQNQLCWLTTHDGWWQQNKQSPDMSLLQHRIPSLRRTLEVNTLAKSWKANDWLD